MEPLRLERYHVVESATPASTTSGDFVDDPYAYIEVDLPGPRTVLVIYQAHNDLGQIQDPHGRGTAVSVDGVDAAAVWDSTGWYNYPLRSASVWVGVLGQGRHVIKGRFCGVEPDWPSTVGRRVLLVLVFTGDWFYYIEDDSDVSTTSGALVDDPYAQVQAEIPQGAVVVAIYSATAEFDKPNMAGGVVSAVRAGGADRGVSGKCGLGSYTPLQTVSACGLAPQGGLQTIGGRFAASYDGYTATVSRRQLAVLVLDGRFSEVDYLESGNHFSTRSTEFVEDPWALLTRDVGPGPVAALVVANGYKESDRSESEYGMRYGVSIDGRIVSYTGGSEAGMVFANSAFAFYAVDLAPGTHAVRGVAAAYGDTYGARVTSRYLLAVWMLYPAEAVEVLEEVAHSKMPPPGITVDGYVVPAYLDEWGRVRINGVLEDGTIVIAVPVAPPPPPAVREFVTAMSFPMVYMAKPARAQQLISKVEGAAVVRVARDYPELLIKRNRANELRSKF